MTRASRTIRDRQHLSARARGAIALTVVAAIVLVAWQRPDPFASPRTVRVALRDAAGLRVGSEVRVSGTGAGEVSAIRRTGDRVVAALELRDDVPVVRRDASAAIWPRLIFEGNAYVELRTGSRDQPPLGDDVVPVGRTTSYVPLDRVLRVADAPTRRGVRRVARGLARASDVRPARAASRALRRAPGLLKDAARVSHAVGGPALRRAVAGLARTGDALADHDADLVPALRDAARTAGALHAGDGAALRATVRVLPGTLAELRAGTARADLALARLDAFSARLPPALRAVAPTVGDARPVLRRAGRVATDARPLLASGRQSLRRAAALAPAARGLVADASPALATLNGSLLPALERPTPTLHLPAYVAFLNMFAGGGGASRAFQRPSANPMQQGDGHFMRFGMRFLTGVGVPVPLCADVGALSGPLRDLLASQELCTP